MVERALCGDISRRTILIRKFGGRIVFVLAELEGCFSFLDGCGLDQARRNLALRRGEEVHAR